MEITQLSLEAFPPGYCQCGCGQKTKIATRNRKEIGWAKGQPLKYVVGHNRRYRGGPSVPLGKKWCGKCRKVKDISKFYKSQRAAGGLQGHCKECARKTANSYRAKNRKKIRAYDFERKLRKKYGISLEAYQELLKKQDGKCAICDEPEAVEHSGIPRFMGVDHDHETGQIRGLLCNKCNGGLGLLRDDIKILQRAIAYLEQWQSA